MEVYGKDNIKKKTFKNLENGDVFFFVDDYDDDFTEIQIYMKCGHTLNELAAVNLETGICYTFDKDTPIEILNAVLHIREVYPNE